MRGSREIEIKQNSKDFEKNIEIKIDSDQQESIQREILPRHFIQIDEGYRCIIEVWKDKRQDECFLREKERDFATFSLR